MNPTAEELLSPSRQEKERRWVAPFTFIQAADTQMGLIDRHLNKVEDQPNTKFEMELCRKAITLANSLLPRPKFFVVCGDLVDAWPWRQNREGQVRDFKKIFEELHADIALVCVCGNHDVGDVPTAESVRNYRQDFGDDFFSFWVGGCKFLVINSQYYYDSSNVPEIRRSQDVWLERELRPNPSAPWRHLMGFQHIPPFVQAPNEEPVSYGPLAQTKGFFGFPDVVEREKFLGLLKAAGLSKLFCGHVHRNAGGHDGSLEVVVTSAIGAQFGPDQHGFRLVRVLEDRIEHQYVTLPE